MNERIRELVEQARVQDRGYFIYQYGGPTGHQSVEKAIDLEKFAELIVRECAALLKKEAQSNYDEGTETYNLLLKESKWIKKYFGVEE